VPYGVYDISNNVGWVSVGTDHETACLAVNAIRRWWVAMGKKTLPLRGGDKLRSATLSPRTGDNREVKSLINGLLRQF
jgi:hypothetical protein